MNPVEKNHVTRKSFSFKIGKVNLDFTLRTDIKTELEDFKQLLVDALEEVTKDLEEQK